MWECPDLFDAGNGNYVLIYSSTGHLVYYKIGRMDSDGLTFIPNEGFVEDGLTLDFGEFYAARSFIDEPNDNLRTLWGWIRETRQDTELIQAGWAGLMSLPRAIGVITDSDNVVRLWMQPHPQVDILRSTEQTVISNNQFLIDNLSADIVLKLESGKAFNMIAVSTQLGSPVDMFDLYYDGRFLRLNSKTVDMAYQ